jgi:hypothetical protein
MKEVRTPEPQFPTEMVLANRIVEACKLSGAITVECIKALEIAVTVLPDDLPLVNRLKRRKNGK